MTENNKPFAMFFNASPRKDWNTAKARASAAVGAREAGAETELVDLFDIQFTGCKSCFACKLKNATTGGVCALRDGLRPVLERARKADVLVFGSPIYFSNTTGAYRNLFERIAFPVFSYHFVDGVPQCDRSKAIETASIFTMGMTEEGMRQMGYPAILESNEKSLSVVFGASETLYIYDTYQFSDYSRYDVTAVREEDKRLRRDTHFTIDMDNARALGKRLVERAKTHGMTSQEPQAR